MRRIQDKSTDLPPRRHSANKDILREPFLLVLNSPIVHYKIERPLAGPSFKD